MVAVNPKFREFSPRGPVGGRRAASPARSSQFAKVAISIGILDSERSGVGPPCRALTRLTLNQQCGAVQFAKVAVSMRALHNGALRPTQGVTAMYTYKVYVWTGFYWTVACETVDADSAFRVAREQVEYGNHVRVLDRGIAPTLSPDAERAAFYASNS